jgi:hypothetical protein
MRMLAKIANDLVFRPFQFILFMLPSGTEIVEFSAVFLNSCRRIPVHALADSDGKDVGHSTVLDVLLCSLISIPA